MNFQKLILSILWTRKSNQKIWMFAIRIIFSNQFTLTRSDPGYFIRPSAWIIFKSSQRSCIERQKLGHASLKHSAVLTIPDLWNFYENYRQTGRTKQPQSPLEILDVLRPTGTSEKIIYELAIPSSRRVIALWEHYGSWLTSSWLQ